MIEISHKQARRLLRMAIDRRVPEDQWANLEAHLENCPTCREYRAQLTGLEKDLSHALRAYGRGAGWEHPTEMDEALPAIVANGYHRKQQTRQQALRGGMIAAALLVIFLLGRAGWLTPANLARLLVPGVADAAPRGTPAAQAVAQATVQPTATPIATARPGDFPALVAYESRRGGKPNGDSDIYLLNPGSQPTDLTNNPAEDTDPSWSPDGNWLAFLSTRSGKVEVYVTDLVRAQPIQVTDSPNITWQGPISWQSDGQKLALTGMRDDQGGQSWVYTVALDGAGAQPVAGTRGGESPKFSPTGDRLAFTVNPTSAGHNGSDTAGLILNHLETGETAEVNWQENRLVPPAAPGSAFDWSPDGQGLAYLANSPTLLAQGQVPGTGGGLPSEEDGVPGSLVLAARNLGYSVTLFSDSAHTMGIAQSIYPGAFRGVTWTPNGGIVYLEDLEDSRAHDLPGQQPLGCWTVQASYFINRGQSSENQGFYGAPGLPGNGTRSGQVISFGNVCVQGGLDRGSWTPDGRWIVVQGRLPGETKYSLFAMRMPGGRGGFYSYDRQRATPTPGPTPSTPNFANAQPGTVLRLVDDPWVGKLPRVRPRLRYASAPLNIDPRPVPKAEALLPAANFTQGSGGPPGQILFTIQNNTMRALVSANPDGTSGRLLLASPDYNTCPRWSLDSQQVAFVQQRGIQPGAGVGGGADLGGTDLGSSLSSAGPSGAGPNPSGSSAVATTYPGYSRADANTSRGAPSGPPSASGSASGSNSSSILVLDLNSPAGQVTREVSQVLTVPGSPKRVAYGCPAWSPQNAALTGGPYLAAAVDSGQDWFLAVMPVNGPSQANSAPLIRYLNIREASGDPDAAPANGVDPVWTPDGRTLYMALNGRSDGRASILAVDVPQDPLSPLTGRRLTGGFGASATLGLALEPNGKSLLTLDIPVTPGIAPGGGQSAAQARLNIVVPGTANTGSYPDLVGGPLPLKPEGPAPRNVIGGSLHWLYGSTYGILLNGAPGEPAQAAIYTFDLTTGRLHALAALTDRVNSAAWSADGRYLVYSSESGLWGLDVFAALAKKSGPVWLSPQPVQDLDWR